MSNADKERFCETLDAIAQTQAALDKIPPQYVIATGHDDHIMLFITRFGDVEPTVDILFSVISLAECDSIARALSNSGGLIKKRLPIDAAMRLQEELQAIGTQAKLVLPVDD